VPTERVARGLIDPSARFVEAEGVHGAALVAAATRDRVLVLLGSRLRDAGRLSEWPSEFIHAHALAERQAIAVECVRHAELTRVLAALAQARISALLFKGSALAQTHYAAPHLRSRTDTDILVRSADVPALARIVADLGYQRPAQMSGRLVSFQQHFAKDDRYGVLHVLDVHWRISNRQALADRITFDELWEHRVPLPALGPSAAAPGNVHALLIALIHRAGHHPGSRDLRWMYDLHVLADRLSADDVRQVAAMAGDRGLETLARDALIAARARFGSCAADRILAALDPRIARPDHVAVVRGRWSRTDILLQDLRALPDWRARGRLIREHLLAPASYMRDRYGIRSNTLLPGLYVWRALRGAPKWLKRDQRDA
jgi:Uncharacterised nucleotidyltransferase